MPATPPLGTLSQGVGRSSVARCHGGAYQSATLNPDVHGNSVLDKQLDVWTVLASNLLLGKTTTVIKLLLFIPKHRATVCFF